MREAGKYMNLKSSNKRQNQSENINSTTKIKGFFKALLNWGKKHIKALRAALFVVLVGILSVAFVGIGILGYVFSVANGEKYLDLAQAKEMQNQTSIIYATNAKGEVYEYQRLHGRENRIWVSLSEMSPHMKDAVIALEDKRFESHHGVDWIRTFAAIVRYTGKQGGSTITQQLVKNLTNEKDVTINRKFHEITYALNLEKNFSKDEILEGYLNTIYLGEGCYGVKTAAEKYFGKDVKDLSLAECASILSITNAPTAYNPLLDPETNHKRLVYCLDEMEKMGTITAEEKEAAANEELIFTNSSKYIKEHPKTETTRNEEVYNYYVEYVIDDIIKGLMEEKGYSKSKATNLIYYGGLQIYCNVDSKVQNIMDRVFTNRETFVEKGDDSEKDANSKNAQAAMVIMDYEGKVLGVAGGAGKKTGNRVLNRATDSYRQPGSSIKPLSIYAPAIENGLITWSSLIPDKQIYDNGKLWPQNYGGGSGSGKPVTVQNALVRSLNTVPVRILGDLTLQTSYDFFTKKLHFDYLDDELDLNRSTLALGGMSNGVRVIDMAAAYAIFGNGGIYYEPSAYSKVLDANGKEILKQNAQGERVISEGNAGVLCKMLQGVVTDGMGTARAYPVSGFQTMVKTGTTSDDKDRWFCAGTPYYISASWYGYDKPKPIRNVSGHPAGNFFKLIMNELHKDLEKKEFAISKDTVQKSYCTTTGLLASANCPKGTGWYDAKKLPTTCKGHADADGGNEKTSENTTQETTAANMQANADD